LEILFSKYSISEKVLRIATGSEIFFSPKMGCGGWFQKMALRKIV